MEEAARKIPNMCNPAVPIGKLDTENLEVKKVGTPRKFDFEPRDHVQLMEELDLIDFERGTKVSGQKFYYLKNEAVFLEQALIMYTLNLLRKHGFTPFITPDVARQEILQGIGFNPRGNESNVYCIEEEGTCLVATAEITLGGYHSEEILDKSKLPLMYCGLSHCFRREAGAAGQFTVLKDHAPLVTALDKGRIRYVSGGKEAFLPIKEGFVQVGDNRVDVCVEL